MYETRIRTGDVPEMARGTCSSGRYRGLARCENSATQESLERRIYLDDFLGGRGRSSNDLEDIKTQHTDLEGCNSAPPSRSSCVGR